MGCPPTYRSPAALAMKRTVSSSPAPLVLGLIEMLTMLSLLAALAL